MTEQQYLSLCEKYLNGLCTAQEEILIKRYQDDHFISHESWGGLDFGNQDSIKQQVYHKLKLSMHPVYAPVVSMRKWWFLAASILFISALGSYLFIYSGKPTAVKALVQVKRPAADIMPGSSKAVLTLANGKTIVLDNAVNGVISKQGSSVISKSGEGVIIKTRVGNDVFAANAKNTITIPRGGRYDITLPDGTKVWLNSSSSLTFPTAFTGTERRISLTGEAYFEVAKNKNMPFKIDVNGKQTIEVLGTHFNVNAYEDEKAIKTSLLEGSVKINYKNTATLLKPGEMAVNTFDNNIEVKPGDLDEVMAWKNDMFMFNNDNITTIMKEISRWYDVDVAYKGNVDNVSFIGNYSRKKSLANLLKNIELMDNIHFVVEGRRITVIGK